MELIKCRIIKVNDCMSVVKARVLL